MQEVGIARLSWYNGTFGDALPLRDHAFIVIPHLHPGRDQKSKQAVIQRRVYCLTHFVTITYADTAIDVIRSLKGGSFDRQSLCEHIIHRSETRLEQADFWPHFQHAKNELAKSWAKDRENFQREDNAKIEAKTFQTVTKETKLKSAPQRRSTWYPNDVQMQELPNRRNSSLDDIPNLSVVVIGQEPAHHGSNIIEPRSCDQQALFKPMKGECHSDNVVDCDDISDSDSFLESEKSESCLFNRRDFILSILSAERAYAEPGSCSRRRQVKKLWNKNVPALHEIGFKTACNWTAFENFMSQQPKDHWFIACMAAVEDPDTMCAQKRDVILSFRPLDVSDNEDWLNSFENRRKALQMACRFYLDNQTRWVKERKRGLRLTPKTVKDINDGHLHINPHAVGKIKWQRFPEHPPVSINLTLPKSAIPLTWFDKRTIHFHENGIDVKNEDGVTFYPLNRPRKATLLKDFFKYSKFSEALISLWEEITGLIYERKETANTTSPNFDKISSRQYGLNGRPMIKINHDLMLNPQNSPPQVSIILTLIMFQ